jgi:hypothetical protein
MEACTRRSFPTSETHVGLVHHGGERCPTRRYGWRDALFLSARVSFSFESRISVYGDDRLLDSVRRCRWLRLVEALSIARWTVLGAQRCGHCDRFPDVSLRFRRCESALGAEKGAVSALFIALIAINWFLIFAGSSGAVPFGQCSLLLNHLVRCLDISGYL